MLSSQASDFVYRYYSLFIASNAAAALFYFFFLPETVSGVDYPIQDAG
jgi:hypothetical protein